jgi:hypothetical protein
MREFYSTDDLDIIASRICAGKQGYDWRAKACWIDTLVSASRTSFQYELNSLGNSHFSSTLVYASQTVPSFEEQDARRGYGGTVFHCAVFACNTRMIRRLVRLGYDINIVDSTSETAVENILWLNQQRDFDVLRTLCEEGANVNFTTRSIGNPYILRKFIESCRQSYNNTICMDSY